jgi:DNA-binding NtrC family response regulator
MPVRASWREATVLVVDDDHGVVEVVRLMLERQGFRVLCASSGEQALAMSTQETGIDVVLSDVVLGSMSGAEFADRVVEYSPGARVVFISGWPHEVVRSRGVDPEAAFLAKPFSLDTLVAAVHDALSRPPVVRAAAA